MILKVFINTLIRFDDGSLKRVLWIDDDFTIMILIDLENNQMPFISSRADIELGLENGLFYIEKKDPYIRITVEEMLNQKHKEIRDKAWESIKEIAYIEPDIYSKDARRKLILQACENSGLTEQAIYSYLKKYWKFGKIKDALLPNFDNCGGPGKRRNAKDKKLGRPRKNPELIGEGINITDDIKRMFEVTRTRYLNTKDLNESDMYKRMLQDCFSQKVKKADGSIQLELDKQYPSLRQFRYWMEEKKNENIEEYIRKKRGNRDFELKFRAILGKSDRELIGSGSIYQIDATIADVYLKSRYNDSWIIGRPVVYLVIDVFSRMVTGVYVGLEGPSWIGAMMALANAMSSKVSYCKGFGIIIKEEEWPCFQAPKSILGDKGELISPNAEQMVKFLEIGVENDPSFRADLKGIVERKFKTIQGRVIPLLPGAVLKDFGKRGTHDYRIDGTLDIEEFTKIIILSVLEHNQSWLGKFERDKDLISDDIKPRPIELWNWGIRNRAGKLRVFNEDAVKLSLMPIEEGRVTSSGIMFKGMRYNCERAMKGDWYTHARLKGSWKVMISFDPRNMDNVYLVEDNAKSYDICYLLDERRYGNRTLDEIIYLFLSEKMQQDESKPSDYERAINTNELMDKIISNSKPTKKRTASAKSIVDGIRTYRRIEKEELRKKQAFKPQKSQCNVIDKETTKKDHDNVDALDSIDFLQKMQDEYFDRKDTK